MVVPGNKSKGVEEISSRLAVGTYLGRSPRWCRDPVLCHTSNSPGPLRQWWRAPLCCRGETGTAWKGGACSCSHRQNSCRIHFPPNRKKRSQRGRDCLHRRSTAGFFSICTMNRLVPHLHCYNRTTVLVEKGLDHGEQLAHPCVYCRNVIWEIHTHTIDLLTVATGTGATCDFFPYS